MAGSSSAKTCFALLPGHDGEEGQGHSCARKKTEPPYSFEITSFSDSDAMVAASMIAATAESPKT